jgi:hypothetical protein
MFIVSGGTISNAQLPQDRRRPAAPFGPGHEEGVQVHPGLGDGLGGGELVAWPPPAP